MSMLTYLAPQLYGCYPKDGTSYNPAPIANTACIYESHKTIANKEVVCAQAHLPKPMGYTSRRSAEETGKNAHLTVSLSRESAFSQTTPRG